MTEETSKYRKSQLEKVADNETQFATKIKIISPDGCTHWIDITEDEFEKIRHILTSLI